MAKTLASMKPPRPSTTTVFAPGATGNLYVDPATGQIGQAWAFNTSVVATPLWTGACGFRAALAYQKNLGKWLGRHQASVFRQDMESWVNQMTWRFYETDSGGGIIQNLANITNAESGRNVMPAVWVPIFPNAILGGKNWRVDTIAHPNTTTVNGVTVVGLKANASASIQPFLVPSDPANPASQQIPLSLGMLKDPTSPYFAIIESEGGQITNAQNLGLLTPGVGTGVSGHPISQRQLGFVSPTRGTLIVRRAGEATVGYAERSFSWVNTYRFTQGKFAGLSVGLVSSFQQNYRGYMYNDAADGNKRKMFLFPNRILHDMFASYSFRPTQRTRASLQVNISNLLDANQVLYLVNSANGTLRYAQWFNAPRKIALTSRLSF